MSTPKRAVILPEDEASEISTPLPCGCRLPFARCHVADDLLNAEWDAGEDMLRIGRLPGVGLEDYAAARARWQAARRAYDAHIRPPQTGSARAAVGATGMSGEAS